MGRLPRGESKRADVVLPVSGKVVPLNLSQMIRALGRQWAVLLLGLALTFVATYQVSRPSEVYWTQTTVRFVPTDERPGVGGNTLVTTSESLIALAGLVLADLDLDSGVEVSGLGPSILDVGDYDGVWVRLPDGGGQWAHSFDEAFLDVQVSGPSPEEVRRRTTETVDKIRVLAAHRIGTVKDPAVLIRPVPQEPVVEVGRGSEGMAVVGALSLGSTGSVAIALGLDSLLRGRSLRTRSVHRARHATT